MLLIMGLTLIGLSAGVLSGLFGIGGGILIVPALMYGLGFSQKLATGTSLAILLPPVGIAAVMEYYRQGAVDMKAAMIIAVMVVVGSWFGSKFSVGIDPVMMKLLFGIFLILLGGYIIYDATSG
jgi:uncharacterized membrane protein YfcA